MELTYCITMFYQKALNNYNLEGTLELSILKLEFVKFLSTDFNS